MPVDLTSVFPPFGLRVETGRLSLRYPTDEDVTELVEVAARGIHDPARMPFYVPWTEATGDTLRTNTAQYFWRKRAEFSPAEWALPLVARYDGVVVGVQAVETKSFLVTRTGETGSWLGMEFQGKGTGTLMRRAICALAFDHLGFAEITSGAFTDNPPSLAVSRNVGYLDNGRMRLERRAGELAINQSLVLTTGTFERAGVTIEVTGAAELRRFIGLDT